MNKISILFLIVLLTASCGVSDERIDAYERAAKKANKATSSEALELIAYDLSKELHEIDMTNVSLAQMEASVKSGSEEYKKVLEAISEARNMFNETLSDKETVFYINRVSDK